MIDVEKTTEHQNPLLDEEIFSLKAEVNSQNDR